MSWVNTADCKPYGESFAMRMASSTEVKRTSGATGPKVSSLNIGTSTGTSVRTVGSMKAPRRLPPARSLAPAWMAALTTSSTPWAANSLISGPTSVSSCSWSPTLSALALVVSRSAKRSWTEASTKMRLTAQQICPLPRASRPRITASAAFSRSASARMIKASLPPSSRWTFFSCSAASWAMRMPTAVLPVTVTSSIPGACAR